MTDKKEPATTPETEENPTSTAAKETQQQVQIDESGAVCAYGHI